MMELFIGYFLVALRVGLTGFVWSGRDVPDSACSALENRIVQLARIIVIGLVGNLLPILVLAAVSWWTPWMDWLVWLAVLMVGWLIKRPDNVFNVIAPIVLVFLVALPPVIMPHRSEWLAGGWDPGLYINNAIAIAQRDGLAPLKNSIYADMTREERILFSAQENDYREVFPGVPINIEDGSLPLYFFHLTPLFGAWLFRAGDFELLFRFPAILAFWGLPVFLGLCMTLGARGRMLAACGLFWCLNPVWWYQQAIPTTEMMYVLLMLGGLMLYLHAVRDQRRWPMAAALAWLAATVNHFNFPVFGGIMLVALALSERFRERSGSRHRVATAAGGILAGIVITLITASVTLSRLEAKDHAVTIVLSGFLLLILASAVILMLPAQFRFAEILNRLLPLGAALMAIVIVLAASICIYGPVVPEIIAIIGANSLVGSIMRRVDIISSFIGDSFFLLAGFGLWNLSKSGSKQNQSAMILAVVSGFMIGMLLISPGIAPTYPWGLRRYVPLLLPFMAIAAGGIFAGFRERTMPWRVVACIVLLLGVWSGLQGSRAGGNINDYRGMHKTLLVLSGKIKPNDLVVADDPRYGTALKMIFGHQVINGRLLWLDKNVDEVRKRIESIESVGRALGGRILWITTDDVGYSIYPVPPRVNADPAYYAEFALQRVIHHPKSLRFEMGNSIDIIQIFEQKMKP